LAVDFIEEEDPQPPIQLDQSENIPYWVETSSSRDEICLSSWKPRETTLVIISPK
jgi:hypothetical protein